MKAARRPLFWYSLSMWVMSFVFSALLIQLGSLIMSDVPTAGTRITREDFIDSAQLESVDDQIRILETELISKRNSIEDAQFVLESRSLDYQNQRTSFDNWIKTRSATEADSQNADVTKRANAIEQLKLEERKAEQVIEKLEQDVVQLNRSLQDFYHQRSEIWAQAESPYERAEKRAVLKVFALRLALTLPLLLISGWLISKKRKSSYWPVYRGFVIFSLFAFFVELVPYLPSYGGYVRYIVGIVLALIVAHFATKGMARYLQNKNNEEKRPETEKRKLIEYETAVKKISSGQCPSCDRQFGEQKSRHNKTPSIATVDFCVHCGFCLYSNCANCGKRDNSFYKFCGGCGVPSPENTNVAMNEA